jgi:tetratricopeptide (TPR) repeat protein
VVLYARCLKVEDRGKQRLDVALSRGDALRDMHHYQEALDFLQEWKIYAMAESREGELGLRVNECMALLGRANEAIGGYRNLAEKFPRTSVAYEAQFRIGYLYESAFQDFDNAAREYDKLRNQPQSEFSSQALRRSQNLSTLRAYRTAMASDTTQARASAAFLLAELYYFQLEKPDSAVMHYRRVEWEFPRSVYAAKSAYARLWITAHDHNDTLAAMALTDSIVAKYRGTRFAESALYLWKRWSGRSDQRTALFDSLLANPDTSRAGWFEPEVVFKPPPSAVDSAVVVDPRQGVTMTAADSARIDSLREVARKVREARMKDK